LRRLFTFGCSFTNYIWPTWADFLGTEFDYFENWGIPGLGNVAIANRLAEAHSKHKFTKDDTIVIQWSSHIRNDYHTFRLDPRGRISGWKTKGSIFNYINRPVYDRRWIDSFFDEQSYLMYSLNSMVLVKSMLENIGCQWAMTSMSDFSKAGSDINDPNGYAENTGLDKDIWTGKGFDKNIDFSMYRETIGFDIWCESLLAYSKHSEDKHYQWQDVNDAEPWVDPHPSIGQHYNWMNDVLKAKLGLPSAAPSITQQQWLDQTEKNYQETKDYFLFEQKMMNLPNWKKPYIGY
jgi:hypothetical protein